MNPLNIIIVVLLGVGATLISWASGTDGPFIPTIEDFKKVLQKAGIKKDKIFYDLGSGDGRVVFEAAKMGADSFGVEQSWLRVFFSRFKGMRLGLKNAHFFHGSIFNRHYYPLDCAYISLSEKGAARIEEVLHKELKKGATVITYKHHFKQWKPKEKINDFWIYQA